MQLNKPLYESDERVIHQSLTKLLGTKELGSYLAVFCGVVNHLNPSFSFNKAYHGGVFARLVPIRWPLPTDSSVQNWLHFVKMTLEKIQTPINPYYVLNLILIAPYYALAQSKPTYILANELTKEIAQNLLGCLTNLNEADKILLKNNIQIGLNALIVEFQQWVNQYNEPVFPCAPPVLMSEAFFKIEPLAREGVIGLRKK